MSVSSRKKGVFEDAMTVSARSLCDCPEPCGYYSEGYVQSKERAHFEIRTVLDSNHSAICGCEPCRIVREVVARRLGQQLMRTV